MSLSSYSIASRRRPQAEDDGHVPPPTTTLYKFAVRDMKAYVQNCEHTQELFHYSTNKCAHTSQQKEKCVLDVTRACSRGDEK
eukprot:COSAG05_NODE_2852_length_2570_cov_24.741805_3_plen_83_part_00